jgi:hypothetical protein
MSIYAAAIVTGLITFQIGKFYERRAWNKLIERGILPKPKTKNEIGE